MLTKVMGSVVARTTLRIVLGQFLAMCMSVTGLFTTLLVEDNSSLPLLQSVTAYTMICALFACLYVWFVVRHRAWINQQYCAADAAISPLSPFLPILFHRIVCIIGSSSGLPKGCRFQQ